MKPSHLTCDFEIVAIRALKSIFSEAQGKTYFFHYSPKFVGKYSGMFSSYFAGSDNDLTNGKCKSARDWFNGAVDLLSIPREHNQSM